MPDQLVVWIFGTVSFLSVLFGGVATYYAYKNSHTIENELKMVFWGVGAIAGFVMGGLCWAWFLIPIIFNHL